MHRAKLVHATHEGGGFAFNPRHPAGRKWEDNRITTESRGCIKTVMQYNSMVADNFMRRSRNCRFSQLYVTGSSHKNSKKQIFNSIHNMA